MAKKRWFCSKNERWLFWRNVNNSAILSRKWPRSFGVGQNLLGRSEKSKFQGGHLHKKYFPTPLKSTFEKKVVFWWKLFFLTYKKIFFYETQIVDNMNAHLFPFLKFFFRQIFSELRAFESDENCQILRFLRFKARKWPKSDMVFMSPK